MDHPLGQDALPRCPDFLQAPGGIAAVDDDVEDLVVLASQLYRLAARDAASGIYAEHAGELFLRHAVMHRLVADREEEAALAALLVGVVHGLQPGEGMGEAVALAAVAAAATFQPEAAQLLDDAQVCFELRGLERGGIGEAVAERHGHDMRIAHRLAVQQLGERGIETVHHEFLGQEAHRTGDVHADDDRRRQRVLRRIPRFPDADARRIVAIVHAACAEEFVPATAVDRTGRIAFPVCVVPVAVSHDLLLSRIVDEPLMRLTSHSFKMQNAVCMF